MTKLRIECEKGWWKVIETCHESLKLIDPDYEPVQIKEKYGSLRYYFNTSKTGEALNAMHAIVARAEILSTQTCENCGHSGKTEKIRGWYKTLCEICADNRRNR